MNQTLSSLVQAALVAAGTLCALPSYAEALTEEVVAQANTTGRSVVTAPATVAPAPEPTVVKAPEPSAAPPFYRGSSISYRNAVAAVGLNRAAEPTHNPYYAMQLSFSPRVWLSEKLYTRAAFDIVSEFTVSDSTTDRFVIGDLALAAGLDGIYTIPVLAISVSPELSLTLPTSKASRAATRIMSNAVSVELARKFGIFSLSYSGSVEKFWNGYTTGASTSALLGVCDVVTGSGCVDMMVQSGRRNADWTMSHGLKASIKPWSTLSFSLGAGVSTAFLYALQDAPQMSLHIQQPSNERYFMSTTAAASWKANDMLTVGLGARASYAQLAPDGSYRAPFLNRFTQLYLDLGLNVAALISKLKS